jgi:hypothetical protein
LGEWSKGKLRSVPKVDVSLKVLQKARGHFVLTCLAEWGFEEKVLAGEYDDEGRW